MELTKDILKEFQKPFPVEQVGLKVQYVFDKEKPESNAIIVPFIDARDAAQRLDDVVGGEWFDNYSPAPKGGLECALTVCGVTRRDVGSDDNDTETEKSGYSDAFKRAAVKFGIGRYLYYMPVMFATAEKSGKNWRIKQGEEAKLRKILGGEKSTYQPPATTTQSVTDKNAKTAAPAQPTQTQSSQVAKKHPPLSPVQRNKLAELWKTLHGGDETEVSAGLDKLFTESFKHGINEATYEEGARLTGQLLQELRNKPQETK